MMLSKSYQHQKRAIRKKIVSWVTGVLGANINNYKHSNLALLQSAAKGVKPLIGLHLWFPEVDLVGTNAPKPIGQRLANLRDTRYATGTIAKVTNEFVTINWDGSYNTDLPLKKKNRYKPHFFMFTIRVLMLFLCYMYQMLCPCCLHFPLSSGILLPLQVQYIKMNKK